MKILTTIKELSKKYGVPIRLMVESDGVIKVYVGKEEIDHLKTKDSTTEDFVCFCIREFVEIYFRR
nr:MAG TPA: hypothetical protein [Caudoviricetes sp.]